MAITYPLSIPTSIGVESIELRAVNATAITESPFTFRQKVVQHTGMRWEAKITVPPLRKDVMEDWIAFVVSLKGHYGTFLLGDPNMTEPRGTAKDTPGTPLVFGAGQTGSTLNIDGCPISATGYLLAGDYIQLGTGSTANLYKVLKDVNTDVSGVAILDIWPDIITAPADNATVVLTDTVGRFRLADRLSEWTINNQSAYGLSIDAIGVVP